MNAIQKAVDDYGVNHWLAHRVGDMYDTPETLAEWHKLRIAAVADALAGSSVLAGAGAGSLLDVACATGELTALLADITGAARVVGLEGCDAVRKEAARKFPKIEFVHALVEDIPYPCDSFGWVHAGEILEHVADPAALVRSLSEIAANGVVMTTPANVVGDPGHVRIFTAEALRELFAPFFERVTVTTTEHPIWCTHVVKAEHDHSRPAVLYVADAPFPDGSGYATQTRYTMGALALRYDVTCLARGAARETRIEDGIRWEFCATEDEALAFRAGWFARFGRAIFRHPAFARVMRERADLEGRIVIHTSGDRTGQLAIDAERAVGIVCQGSVVNPSLPPPAATSPLVAVPIGAPVVEAPDLPRFVMVGQVHPIKGVAEIARAFEPLAGAARLCVVGGMDATDAPWYFGDVTAALGSPWVECVGPVPRAAVVPILRGAAGLVHWNVVEPGITETAQATKIAESMVAGVPVIARRTLGTESMLGPRYPYLCETEAEVVAAARAILALTEPKRRKLATDLRKRAAIFAPGSVAAQWGEVLGC